MIIIGYLCILDSSDNFDGNSNNTLTKKVKVFKDAAVQLDMCIQTDASVQTIADIKNGSY